MLVMVCMQVLWSKLTSSALVPFGIFLSFSICFLVRASERTTISDWSLIFWRTCWNMLNADTST